MKIATALVLATLAVPSVALACGDQQYTYTPPAQPESVAQAPVCRGAQVAQAGVRTVTVDEVAALQAARKATIVDANGDKTRTANGVIAGAVLLTSAVSYEARELPAGRRTPIVFYCANEKCGASHAAAERALQAGYTDVAVMPAGILGWRKAGKPVVAPGRGQS
jgi:rhodanese-related sulfurtransferase